MVLYTLLLPFVGRRLCGSSSRTIPGAYSRDINRNLQKIMTEAGVTTQGLRKIHARPRDKKVGK